MKIIKGIIKRIKREKIEAILQKIRYRVYQANIALQSHDGEKLLDMAKLIRINGRLINTTLGKRRGRKKGKADGKRGSRKSSTI